MCVFTPIMPTFVLLFFLFVVREWNLPSFVLRFWGNGIAYSEHDVCIDEPREYKQLPSLGTLVIIERNEQKPLRYLEKIPLPKQYCTNDLCQSKISRVNRMTNSLRLLEGYFFLSCTKHQTPRHCPWKYNQSSHIIVFIVGLLRCGVGWCLGTKTKTKSWYLFLPRSPWPLQPGLIVAW